MDTFSSVPPHIQPPIAQVPSPIRELLRVVFLMVMYSSIAYFLFVVLQNRGLPIPATQDWRTCHRSGERFCTVQNGQLPQPSPFLPKATKRRRSSSGENCGLPEEPAEESAGNHSL